MAINYLDIYRDKTGQSALATPLEDDTAITARLDRAAYMQSRLFATPWANFDSTPDKYKYPVTIMAARQFWFNELGKAVAKFDVKMGATGTNTTANKTAGSIFNRISEMLKMLDEELLTLNIDIQDSGDILVGNLLRRDKFSGRLVPYAEDPVGDWLVHG